MPPKRLPPLPGSVLREQVLKRMGVKQATLAQAMGVSAVRISQIVNGHAPITTEMALRLARVTGTSPEYWLRLQSQFDLFHARSRLAKTLNDLPRLPGVW